MIIPVPSSTPRTMQPVLLVAETLGEKLSVPVTSCINATRATAQLKDIYDPAQRKALLEGLYAVDDSAMTRGKRILLFDDLFRSGATMNAITEVLYQSGGAADVSVLTLTCTRRNS